MNERKKDDFLTEQERAAGGIDHAGTYSEPAEATDADLVASQADQYNSNAPTMTKKIVATNPPPHDDLSVVGEIAVD